MSLCVRRFEVKAFWLSHRADLRRKTVTSLLIALVAPLLTSVVAPTTFSSVATASATTTKTWTVLGSTGSAYAGAKAQIFYFDKGDVAEQKTTIATSDANGQFTFTYPLDPDYLWLVVQVPTTDTTHAIFNRDLLSATDAASGTIQLQAATHKVKITQPDGTDPSASVCINLPTSATNTDVTDNYRTLRAGVLGIKLPSTLARPYSLGSLLTERGQKRLLPLLLPLLPLSRQVRLRRRTQVTAISQRPMPPRQTTRA
jgi:hypothetical protein